VHGCSIREGEPKLYTEKKWAHTRAADARNATHRHTEIHEQTGTRRTFDLILPALFGEVLEQRQQLGLAREEQAPVCVV
jgi:hypothetical protein